MSARPLAHQVSLLVLDIPVVTSVLLTRTSQMKADRNVHHVQKIPSLKMWLAPPSNSVSKTVSRASPLLRRDQGVLNVLPTHTSLTREEMRVLTVQPAQPLKAEPLLRRSMNALISVLLVLRQESQVTVKIVQLIHTLMLRVETPAYRAPKAPAHTELKA